MKNFIRFLLNQQVSFHEDALKDLLILLGRFQAAGYKRPSRPASLAFIYHKYK